MEDTKRIITNLDIKPLPIVDVYRESCKVLSVKILAKEPVAITDPVSFAKEAVKTVTDADGNVTDKAMFGCIQLTPELRFFGTDGKEVIR